MSFDRSWLDMREPYDERARAAHLRDAAASWVNQQPRAAITDLGAGTGATFRYLAPHLETEVSWTFVDNDEAHVRSAAYSTGARPVVLDLSQTFPDFGDLVTASAFFDLVSADWIQRFADTLGGAPLYATLTVDGEDRIDPADPDDDWVMEAFRRHQTETDKGFGVAAGPGAHHLLVDALRERGYRVDEAKSDWYIRGNRGILTDLLGGMARRAGELGGDRSRAGAWLERRLSQTLTVIVGHRDLFARSGSSR